MSSDRAEAARRGRGLVIISGPSGVGKSSICNVVLATLDNAVWSVSATTRPMRPGDTNGETYEFISEEEFQRRLDADAFLETAVYCGHRYGTPRGPVEEALKQGKIVIMEIEVQGAVQVTRKMPDSTRVFVLPPTSESLRLRLEGRNTERREQLRQRLAKADGEIAFARDCGCYEHFVVNDDLDETVREVLDIIRRESCAV